MDKQILALFIPIIALSIPIVAIVMGSRIKLQRLKMEQSSTLPPELEHRINALEGDVTGLRQELTETQERLDFTERLLAQKSQPKPE
jgi:hypothetical protein